MNHTVPGRVWLIALVAAVTVAPAGLVQAQGPGQSVLYEEDFEDGRADSWSLEPGWRVIQDADGYVLAGEGHQWARPDVTFPGDFRVEFRLKLLTGRVHLVYRLNDAGRYFVGFTPDGSDLNKQYWPDTFYNALIASATPHSPGDWHQVEIIGQGSLLQFVVDGREEWTYTDPDPLTYGSFAFETLEDGAAYLDDVVVHGPQLAPELAPAAGGLAWVRTGGPLGGLGYDVRMRPDDPERMYVTDAFAGVHLSTDGGDTWLPSNEGISTRVGSSGDGIPVFCLTVDPNNYDVIWAGTQYQRGIFRSADGGRTWEKMDNGVVEPEGITFRGISVQPGDSNVVYAAGEVSSWTWNGQERVGREFDMTQGVVYKTTDGGQNWTAVWRGDNLARYVWIDPRNPDVLYVSTGIFDREAANSDPEAGSPGGVGVLRSLDGGQTWGQVNSGLENLYIGTLFMHPENPDVLLAGAGNVQYREGGGVYLSTDGGASWTNPLAGEGEIIESVEFAPSDPDIAYAGSDAAVYRSEDGAHTWVRVTGGENGWGPPGVRAGFPIDFQVDPRDPDRIFANNYGGGNFLSTDGGRNWIVASTGYTGAQVRALAVDSAAAGRVLAAARSGLFASYDGGGEWTGLSFSPVASLEWNAVAIDPADAQHVLAGTNWEGVLAGSSDGGYTWSVLVRLGVGAGWRAIAYAPSDANTVYAASAGYVSAGGFGESAPGRGVYVSRDGGATWTQRTLSQFQDAVVTGLAVAPDDLQTVYLSTFNHGLLKSDDGGESWISASLGLPPPGRTNAVAVHPANSEVVFGGMWRGSLSISRDGAATWQQSAAGLNPEANLSFIAFSPTDPQAIYVADMQSGIYRSTDGGQTWTAVNAGLRTRAVNALAFSADGLHLYAATEGEGVYRLDLNGQPPQPAIGAPTAPPSIAPPTAVSVPPSQPTASSAAVPTPTPQPPRLPPPCGSALVLPLAWAGLVWLRRRR